MRFPRRSSSTSPVASLKPGQVAYVAPSSFQFAECGQFLRPDGSARSLAQRLLDGRAQRRIPERGKVPHVVVRVVAHPVAIDIRPLRGVERKGVVDIRRAVVIVVWVGVVAGAVVVHVEPVGRVAWGGVRRIHDAVTVRVKRRRSVGADLKAQQVQGPHRVGAVEFVAGDAAGTVSAVARRI